MLLIANNTINTYFKHALLLAMLMPLLSCSGKMPDNIGAIDGKLAVCPSSPNCVSSEAQKDSHKIKPYQLKQNTAASWQAIQSLVSRLPRTTVISMSDQYLHAECRSLVFRFVDDFELQYDKAEGIVAVRSAARVGRSDFGVNRDRIESFRKLLLEKDLIE